VFTRALLPALTKPSLDLPALAVEVREEVMRLARSVKQDQRPAYYDETSGGRIFLAGPANGRPGGGTPSATTSVVQTGPAPAVSAGQQQVIPRAPNMTFFVTSVGLGKGGDLGGLAGADALCQTLAATAGAGNKAWHAYLSTAETPTARSLSE
jgi:hypothetical protein